MFVQLGCVTRQDQVIVWPTAINSHCHVHRYLHALTNSSLRCCIYGFDYPGQWWQSRQILLVKLAVLWQPHGARQMSALLRS